MLGAAAYGMIGIACRPAVDEASFCCAVACGSEDYGVSRVMINSDVVVHAVRIPIVDSLAVLGGLDTLDHVFGCQSDAGDLVLAVAVGLEFILSLSCPACDRTGQVVSAALDRVLCGRLGGDRCVCGRLGGDRSICGSLFCIKYGAGLDIVGADLLAAHDLVGHIIVSFDGSHGLDVGLDLGLAVSYDLVERLNQNSVLGCELVSAVVLRLGAVRLNNVAHGVDDNVLDLRSQSGYTLGVLFAVIVSLGNGLGLQLYNCVADIEGVADIDRVNSLAFRNLEIRDNGELVADLELAGLGGAVPILDSNDSLVAYGTGGRSVSLSFGRSIGLIAVRAIYFYSRLGTELFLNFIQVNYLDFAGTEVLDKIGDCALACCLNFEVSVYEDLLGREVVAVELYTIVANEFGIVVSDNNVTGLDVGQELIGCYACALVLNAFNAGGELELALVIEQAAFELGDFAGLAVDCVSGNAVHVQ